jgi:pilus assembly protein CpaE
VETKTSVVLEVQNRTARDALEQIIASMDEFQLQHSPGSTSCDLLIMEIGENLQEELHQVRMIQESGKVGGVCLTSGRNDPNLLIEVLRAGAKEFIPQPIQADEVRRSLTSLKDKFKAAPSQRRKGKLGQIISVVGSKGGVGTTTVAVNLATSLINSPAVESVALIDMNLLFGEVPLFLDIKPHFNWGKVAENIARLDSTYLMSILTKHSSGISVLPSPTGLDVGEAADPSVVEKLLPLMREEFDYIVVDSGQSMDPMSLKLLQLSDTALVVCIPSLPCLINVRRLLDTFANLGYPREENTQIVMNRHHKKSVISLKEAREGINKEISWTIPNDYQATMAAINQGKALSAIASGEEITKRFEELAAKFAKREMPEPQRRSIFRLEMARKAT